MLGLSTILLARIAGAEPGRRLNHTGPRSRRSDQEA